MNQFIDTHAHLYSRKFQSDRDDMIQRAIAAGVTRLYLPNIDSESIDSMLDLENSFPDNCFAMMGLHPTSVQADTYEEELKLVEKYLGERKWAGVGETGIDLYWDKSTLDIQQKSFARQIEWAKDLDRPVIIHARMANTECLELVRKAQDAAACAAFFIVSSGTEDEAREMIDLNFMLGIEGPLPTQNRNCPKCLARFPGAYRARDRLTFTCLRYLSEESK
ncbi:MAG: TatD family hydrolase [Saprospiraceae bacterium]